MTMFDGFRRLIRNSDRPFLWRKCLLLIFSLCVANGMVSQNRIVLHVSHWYGSTGRVEIHEGDDLHFKLKNDRARYSGVIQSIGDSLIQFSSFCLKLNDLSVIYLDQSNFLNRQLSKFCRWSGLGYVALDVFNNTTQGTKPIVNETTVEMGSVLFLTGWLIHKASQKRYRIGSRCTLWLVW
jgi:hypothetical protein